MVSCVSIAMWSRPSVGEMPSEIELCESLVLSWCGSVTLSQAPAGSLRRATTAARLAVYQAAY